MKMYVYDCLLRHTATINFYIFFGAVQNTLVNQIIIDIFRIVHCLILRHNLL